MTILNIVNHKMKKLSISTQYSGLQLCQTFEKCDKKDLEFMINNVSNECNDMMAGVYLFTRMAIKELSPFNSLVTRGIEGKRIRKCLLGKKSHIICSKRKPVDVKRAILLRHLKTGILPMIISMARPMIARVTTRGEVGIDLYADCRNPTYSYNYVAYLENAIKMI